MAKSAVVALVLCALLVSAFAAETGRSLQQAGGVKITYDCNGAKQMGTVKNACTLLCSCAGSMNAAFGTPAMKTQCMKMCNACQTAAKTCAPNSPLPQACKAGQGIKEVNSCITAFLRAQG